MITWNSYLKSPYWSFLLSCFWLVFFLFLTGCNSTQSTSIEPMIFGVWMQASSIETPEVADQMLNRIEKGGFNTVLVNVFAYGHAYYESDLLKKEPDVAPEYDPLGYFIEQSHLRGIDVHVWLVAGPVGGHGNDQGSIMAQHPEWAMIGPDGKQIRWLNYNRPDVRTFIGDMALDLVQNYDIDGIHFDYTRYPGSEWGFDPYSTQAFAEATGHDLDLLRYAELPAYGTFQGNALAGMNTAEVLAVFDTGTPAVLLNQYGQGQVILLNWNATERQIAAGSEILRRSVDYLNKDKSTIYILYSETNIDVYSADDFEDNLAWLEDLGLSPVEVDETSIPALEHNGVLVMPNVYRITAQTAADIADFVKNGGSVIFIDGPTASIEDENIQALTGMQTKSGYFETTGFLVSVATHPLIPNSEQDLVVEDYADLEKAWKTFRKQGINAVLADVYDRVKAVDEEIVITITISGDQENLENDHLLDWETWLEGDYVDFIIPRAYVDYGEPLSDMIADWQPALDTSDLFILGLIDYDRNQNNEPKTPERMLAEIEQALASKSKGIIIFDIEHISDDVVEALGDKFSDGRYD